MQDYLVFDTEAEAQATADAIYTFGANYAAAQGYSVDGAGIVGQRLDGTPEPTAARTTAWDIPRQRLDGKWVVLHPQYHPAASDPAAASGLASMLAGYAVETAAEEWFTPPEEI